MSKQIKRVSSALIHIYPSLIHTFGFYSRPPSTIILPIFVLSRGSSLLAFRQGSDAAVAYVALHQSRWLAVGEENTQNTTNSSTYGSVHSGSHYRIHSSIHLSIHPFSAPMASLIPINFSNTYVLFTSQWYLYTWPLVHHSSALVLIESTSFPERNVDSSVC